MGDRSVDAYREFAVARAAQLFRIAFLMAGNLDPPVGVMVRQGERLGRRLRARRRVGIAAGSTVVAAVAGVSLVAGAHHARPLDSALAGARAGDQHRGVGGSATPRTRREASLSPQAPKTPKATPTPGGKTGGGMTPRQMLVTLRRLLPAGSVLSHVNPYSSDRGNLEVDYNDGQGAVDLMISVFPPGTISQATCPNPLWTNEGPRPPGALPISCAMRTLPDGSVERDAVMYADAYGFYGYDVYDLRPDGSPYSSRSPTGSTTLCLRSTGPGRRARWRSGRRSSRARPGTFSQPGRPSGLSRGCRPPPTWRSTATRRRRRGRARPRRRAPGEPRPCP